MAEKDELNSVKTAVAFGLDREIIDKLTDEQLEYLNGGDGLRVTRFLEFISSASEEYFKKEIPKKTEKPYTPRPGGEGC